MVSYEPLSAFLPALDEGCKVISVVGAGGKTSFIEAMAQAYANGGKRVIVATSTKTFVDRRLPLVLENQCHDIYAALEKALKQHAVVALGAYIDAKSTKLVGVCAEKMEAIKQWASTGCAQVLLCEADGAARKALKAPASHEPAIPACTDICFGIMGLDILHKSLVETSVHRAEIFANLVQIPLGTKIQFDHLLCLAHHEHGLFKNCPTQSERHVLLNKAEFLAQGLSLGQCREALAQKQSPYAWWAGNVQRQQLVSLWQGVGS